MIGSGTQLEVFRALPELLWGSNKEVHVRTRPLGSPGFPGKARVSTLLATALACALAMSAGACTSSDTLHAEASGTGASSTGGPSGSSTGNGGSASGSGSSSGSTGASTPSGSSASTGTNGSGGWDGSAATTGAGGSSGTSTGSGGSTLGVIGDPNYREGFGKNATGGASKPTYVVTSSAATGAGSLYAAFQPGDHAHDINIVFAVPTVTIPSSIYIGSNVTIDGMANGMNGVTMDATANAKRAWIIEDPASNIVIRGINFRSTGTPNSGVAEFDLITVDGTNGSAISNLFIDRCTFVQASDGALDITGNVSNVTVQRSLFYGNAITMLVKYGARSNISLHHNVYTHNGERNPQAKGNMQLLDYVNNIIYLNDVPNYPDGTPTSPYGVRIWSANATSESPGNVVANIVGNAFIGSGTRIQLIADSGASLDGVYIDQTGAYYAPASNGAASPKAMPNAIPTEFAVTTLSMDELQSKLLPIVGAPNRTPLDQQRVDDVAAALPSL